MSKANNLHNFVIDSYELLLKIVAAIGIALTLPLMLVLATVAALLLLPLIPLITQRQNQPRGSGGQP